MKGYNFNTEKAKTREEISMREVMLFLFALLKRYPLSLTAVIALSIIAALGELASIALFLPILESFRPEATSHISDQLPIGFVADYLERFDLLDKIRIIALLLLAVETGKAVAKYISGRLGYKFKIKVDKHLRMKCFESLMSAGLKYVHREKIANLFTIINNFTGNTSQVVYLFVTMVPDTFLVLVSFAILLSISVKMTLVTFFFSLITVWALGSLTNLTKRLGREANQAGVKLNHTGFEVLSSMVLIRVFAREKDVEKRFESAVDDVQDKAYKKGLLEAAISPLATTMLVLIVVILLIVSTYILQVEAEHWLEMLGLFLVVFSRLGGPLGRINLQRTQIVASAHSVQMVKEFIDSQDKEVLAEGDIQFDGLKKEIEFDHVRFGYDETEEEVLKDVSFKIPQGKMTAIVGGSGSGKSTLIALISRLYDVNSGRILIDGVPVQDFKARSWRSKIGIVTQNTILFNDTLLSNIKFGKPEATFLEVESAVRLANAESFIKRMKEAYQTQLGDRGIRLSGGQAQRVAIARAILIEPQILLLDEATSALDTGSERQVQKAIDEVSRNRTVVVVAHRLSTIRNADNILVLEEGRLVEQGTHEQLLEKQGVYWKYVRMQDLNGETASSEKGRLEEPPVDEIQDKFDSGAAKISDPQ